MSQKGDSSSSSSSSSSPSKLSSTSSSEAEQPEPEVKAVYEEPLSSSDLCENMINGANVRETVTAENCQDIIEELRIMRDKVLEGPEFDYDRLQKIDDILNEIFSFQEQLMLDAVKQKELEKLYQRKEQALQEMRDINAEIKSAKGIFDEKRQNALDVLQTNQDREFHDLEEKFSHEEIPVKYRKLSVEVLNIRKQEKHLRLTKRYMEAKQCHQQAEALEAFEMEQAKIKWRNDQNAIFEALNHKHQQQIACFNEKWDRQWLSLIPDPIARKEHCQLVIDTIDRRIYDITDAKTQTKVISRVINAKKENVPVTARSVSHVSPPRSPSVPSCRVASTKTPRKEVNNLNAPRAKTSYS